MQTWVSRRSATVSETGSQIFSTPRPTNLELRRTAGATMAEQGPEMTSDEMGMELLDCARYGEVDEVVQLLEAGASINYQDEGGNTGTRVAALLCLP